MTAVDPDLDVRDTLMTTMLATPGALRGPQIAMKLVWNPAAPLEVLARFVGFDAEWVLARELLRDGMYRAAGVGDVQVTPAPGPLYCELHLRSPDGSVSFRILVRGLRGFIERTEAVVAVGAEVFDWDTAEAELRSWV